MTFKKARTLISRLRAAWCGEKRRQETAAASLQKQRSAALIAQARSPNSDVQNFIVETVVQDYRNNGRLRQIILRDGHEGTA